MKINTQEKAEHCSSTQHMQNYDVSLISEFQTFIFFLMINVYYKYNLIIFYSCPCIWIILGLPIISSHSLVRSENEARLMLTCYVK